MKRIFISLITFMLLFVTAFSLVGCFGGETPSPEKDYNADVEVILPENITNEHFVPKEDETYYKSEGFILCISVKGNFMIVDYFTLDGDKRVYDDLFFYEEDYLYIVTDDYKDLYASLGDSEDTQYAEEEKEQGEDIQLNFIKSGIYKVIFDVKTCKFDLEFKSEMETPKYYTIKNCSIFTVDTSWLEMSVNPDNQDEFYFKNVQINTNKSIYFYNNLHVSNYYVTLDSNSQKYASYRKTQVTIFIGGKYNVYINAKNYEVRLELVNKDTADYTCCYWKDNDIASLELADQNVPYIFVYEMDVEKRYDVGIPNFYNAHYQEYQLTVLPSSYLTIIVDNYKFAETGRFRLYINLKTFEITVELLPQ